MNVASIGNLFSTQTFQGIQPTGSVQRRTGAEVAATRQTSENPFAAAVSQSGMFAGNTYGVNTNIGIGDSSYTAGQAGIAAGVGRTIAFA